MLFRVTFHLMNKNDFLEIFLPQVKKFKHHMSPKSSCYALLQRSCRKVIERHLVHLTNQGRWDNNIMNNATNE